MLLVSLPRLVARTLACFVAIAATTAALFAQTPSANDGFDPDFDGNVYVVATQPDGKVLVGGQFAHFRTREGFALSRNNLARLNADGSLDGTFNVSVNGPIRALVVQPNGSILVGGDFTSLQPEGGAATTRNRIARLTATGAVDAFNPNLGGTLQPQVHAILLQPNGSVVVGGTFTTTQPGGTGTVVTRNRLARFTDAGALDTTFDPNPNSIVLALANHIDNKIVVAGGFTSFQEAQRTSPTTRNRIARLNSNGTLDTEFDPNANNAVDALAIQRDGKIVLAGHFTTLQPITNDTAATRNYIGRLNRDGTLDSEFYPNANGAINEVAIQPDGSILIGGVFSSIWGRGTGSVARPNVARFLPDGTPDGAFSPGLNAQVESFAFQPDGKVVVGGYFTRALPIGSTTAAVRNRVARLNTDGSLDATFSAEPGGRILNSIAQADGKVVVAGSFTNIGGATHNYLARFNTNGTIDNTYNLNFNGRVYALAYQSDGKLIAGGAFTEVDGAVRNRIVRINPATGPLDGKIDSEFAPSIDGEVGGIAVQSDGKIIVTGTFTSVTPRGAAEPTTRTNILRLNADGSLDTTFNPTANASISTVAIQSDGKILVGGTFTTFQPNSSSGVTPRSYLARLNADGTVDTAFYTNPNSLVATIIVQSDNKIVIGGAFTQVFPSTATEATTRNRIARLNADGTVDTTYNPNVINGNVVTASLQSDGKIVIGGDFTLLQPAAAGAYVLRRYAARINTDGTVDTTFDLDFAEQAGNRVDSVRVITGNALLVGGRFASLQPIGTASRTLRRNFARIASNGTLDTSFDPGAGGTAGGTVNALAVQADNKVIAVGQFSDLGGAKTVNVARFTPEGAADPFFGTTLTTDGALQTVIVRPTASLTESQLGGFAWLNRDGTLRTQFAPGSNARLTGTVRAAAVQPDGRVVIAGAFTNLTNGTGTNLARLSATGQLDESFNAKPNGVVNGLALQSDGKVIIVGAFTLVGDTARNRIARINADGSLDTAYDPNANSAINAIVLEADGRAIIGGAFTTLQPNAATTATTRNYLARIGTDGAVDANYNPNPNSTVIALVRQSNGQIVAGGSFGSVQPNSATTATTRNYLARFNTDGTLDTNFDPNPSSVVNAIALQETDQKLVVGGAFTSFQRNATGNAVVRNNIARINSDGAIDDFNPNPNGIVNAVGVQSDGAVLLAGAFTTLQPNAAGNAIARGRLARVNPDGSLDIAFNPDFNGDVVTIVSLQSGGLLFGGSFTGLQATGSIVVGGSFNSIGGVATANLAALNDDGSLNGSFQPQPNGAVNALLVQPDGRIIAGGAFTQLRPDNVGTPIVRSRIARFTTDGKLDASYLGSISFTVTALARQSDGKLLVGGGTASAGSLVRLNADGTADAGFSAAGLTSAITGLAVESDGAILVATGTTITRLNENGSVRATFAPIGGGVNAVSAISLDTEGRILVAGAVGAPRTALARLNRDGARDGTYNPDVNGTVTALAVQSDGRVVLGGTFTTIGGLQRVALARLASTGGAAQALTISADRRTLTWVRGGTAGEIGGAIFEHSVDRRTWTTLGTPTRETGTGSWQIVGVNLPTQSENPGKSVFYVRARGIATTTAGRASGLFETIREFSFSDLSSATFNGVTQSTASISVDRAAAWLASIDPFTGMPYSGTNAVTLVDADGASVEIRAANILNGGANGTSRLANLSTRSRVSPGNPLLVGFAVAGTTPRAVLVRGIGPTLATFGVTEALSGTRIQIIDSAGRTVASAEGWDSATNSALINVFARTGAFALPARSGDSAAVLTLQPGAYTLQVTPSGGASGIALAEVYDADTSATSRLMNVSTRGESAPGAGALISGFVIAGDAPARMLLRGAGPSLTQFGATNVLSDPVLGLYDAQGRQLGTNDNWVSGLAQIPAAAASVGAYAFEAGSKDAAVIATLPPGAYSVQVTGSTASTGTALVEVYELP